jgi:hypothetical protein
MRGWDILLYGGKENRDFREKKNWETILLQLDEGMRVKLTKRLKRHTNSLRGG